MSDKEYESIIPTAILTAYPRSLTDIPYAKEMFDELNKEHIAEDLTLDKLALELEARYKLINKLFMETDIDQVLEVAAGYSTRGLDFVANRKINYVELDLKEVADKKKRLISEIVPIPNDLHILGGNALNYDDFNKCARFFDRGKELAIIGEGLMRYLDFEEKKILAENIKKTLSEYGGVWITGDVSPKNFLTNQDESMPSLNKNINNLSSRNNSNWRFEDEEHVREFFEKIGFSLEFHYYNEVKNELTSPKKLNLTSDEVDKTVDSGIVAVMRVN